MALPLIGLAVGALAGGAKKGIGAWQEQKELRKQAKQYNLTQERKASQIEHLASQEGANRQQAYNFASRALAKHNMSQENRERTLAMAQQAMGESLNRAFQARGAAAEARGHKMTVPSAPSFGSIVSPILGGAIEGGLAGASIQNSIGAAKRAKDMATKYGSVLDSLKTQQEELAKSAASLNAYIEGQTNNLVGLAAGESPVSNPIIVAQDFLDRYSKRRKFSTVGHNYRFNLSDYYRR